MGSSSPIGGGGVSGGFDPMSIAVAYTADKYLNKGKLGKKANDILGPPPMPDEAPIPTDADIAAKEPDKERLRRQRMAALMAGGRLGTIFGGGSTSVQPNNMIGGGTGKNLVGA